MFAVGRRYQTLAFTRIGSVFAKMGGSKLRRLCSCQRSAWATRDRGGAAVAQSTLQFRSSLLTPPERTKPRSRGEIRKPTLCWPLLLCLGAGVRPSSSLFPSPDGGGMARRAGAPGYPGGAGLVTDGRIGYRSGDAHRRRCAPRLSARHTRHLRRFAYERVSDRGRQ